MTTLVEWKLPCRPNAKIDKFIIECRRLEVLENPLEFSYNVNGNQEDFMIETKGFLPDSSYNVSVWAVANGKRGLEQFKVVRIEAGCKQQKKFF
jgi:hypothetical protein